MNKFNWLKSLETMCHRSYWSAPNIVEFWGFFVKAIIIFPGLVFGVEIWWLYIFALISSISIIWSSTVKTIPTLIWFNIVWSGVSISVLLKHFL